MADSRDRRGTHPYARWEGTALWKAIDKGIADLVGNDDIIEKTDRKYIVGYLCKSPKASGDRSTHPPEPFVVVEKSR